MELEESLKKEVERLMNEGRKESDTMTDEERIECFKMAWEILPVPKEQYYDSYYIMNWLTSFYLYFENYDEAWKYAKIFLYCDPSRFYGEQEYTYARAAYEVGELDEARKYFAIAEEKSKKWIWKRNDAMKYFKFYKSK